MPFIKFLFTGKDFFIRFLKLYVNVINVLDQLRFLVRKRIFYLFDTFVYLFQLINQSFIWLTWYGWTDRTHPNLTEDKALHLLCIQDGGLDFEDKANIPNNFSIKLEMLIKGYWFSYIINWFFSQGCKSVKILDFSVWNKNWMDHFYRFIDVTIKKSGHWKLKSKIWLF